MRNCDSNKLAPRNNIWATIKMFSRPTQWRTSMPRVVGRTRAAEAWSEGHSESDDDLARTLTSDGGPGVHLYGLRIKTASVTNDDEHDNDDGSSIVVIARDVLAVILAVVLLRSPALAGACVAATRGKAA